MATFKELGPSDVKTSKSYLNQLIDVIQEDISGSTTRKKYQVFVTGGLGPGVTSSIYQTVYDQNHTLQTANPIMDMTIGFYTSSDYVSNNAVSSDSSGKLLFSSQSLMMREKVETYKQYAKTLLGAAGSRFNAPFDTETAIDAALFISFRRLFARDQIKRETFALRFYETGSIPAAAETPNLYTTSEAGVKIYTDVNSAVNKMVATGGEVGNIVDSANTSRTVGLMFYDAGVAVLNLETILDTVVDLSGSIEAMNTGGRTPFSGSVLNFLVSGSIDQIVDHIASTRFSSGTQTAITFQNSTNINSSLYFCRATSDEFNYSSNPTYTDSNDRIVVIDSGQEETQKSFTFVTSVGLYDANDNLLAVAKLSRPVEKNSEKDITFRVRLDY